MTIVKPRGIPSGVIRLPFEPKRKLPPTAPALRQRLVRNSIDRHGLPSSALSKDSAANPIRCVVPTPGEHAEAIPRGRSGQGEPGDPGMACVIAATPGPR